MFMLPYEAKQKRDNIQDLAKIIGVLSGKANYSLFDLQDFEGIRSDFNIHFQLQPSLLVTRDIDLYLRNVNNISFGC